MTNLETYQEQFIRCTDYIGETGRNFTMRLNEQKQATKRSDLNNDIAEGHLKKTQTIVINSGQTMNWDSCICATYSTDYYQRITPESWFTNSEQTALC